MHLTKAQSFYLKTILTIVLLSLVSLFFQPSANASAEAVKPTNKLIEKMMYQTQCTIFAETAGYTNLLSLHDSYIDDELSEYPMDIATYLAYTQGFVAAIAAITGDSLITIGQFYYNDLCYNNAF